jgi:hypothetical protein
MSNQIIKYGLVGDSTIQEIPKNGPGMNAEALVKEK